MMISPGTLVQQHSHSCSLSFLFSHKFPQVPSTSYSLLTPCHCLGAQGLRLNLPQYDPGMPHEHRQRAVKDVSQHLETSQQYQWYHQIVRWWWQVARAGCVRTRPGSRDQQRFLWRFHQVGRNSIRWRSIAESSKTSFSGFKPSQAALDNLKQRKIGQQSQEAIVKQMFSREQREAKDMEEVESGTRPNIASYLLREDSLELQFLYVSQILNNPQTDNKTKKKIRYNSLHPPSKDAMSWEMISRL